jgi:hypothetical protein
VGWGERRKGAFAENERNQNIAKKIRPFFQAKKNLLENANATQLQRGRKGVERDRKRRKR